jgi:transcriptional regulator of nitric oxide reductase
VRLDALAARAGALLERPGLPQAARAEAERAVAAHDEATAGLRATLSAGDVDRLAPLVEEAGAALSRAGAAAGDEPAPDDPFAGLCAADPAHGPAVAEAALDGHDEPAEVCAACAEAAAAGRPPRPRLVPIGGRPAPFTEIDSGSPREPGA